MKLIILSFLLLPACVSLKKPVTTGLLELKPVTRRPANTSSTEKAWQNQCAVDLCGNPTQYLPMQGRTLPGQKISQDIQQYLKDSVDPILNEAIKISAENYAYKIDTVERLIPMLEYMPLDSEQKAYLLVIAFTNKYASAFDHTVVDFSSAGVPSLNFERFHARLPHINPKLLKGLVDLYNVITSESSQQIANSLAGITFDSFMQIMSKKSPEIETLEYQSLLAQHIQQQMNHYKYRLGSFAFEYMDFNVLMRVQRRERLDPNEKKAFMEIVQKFYGHESLSSTAVQNQIQLTNIDLKEFFEEIEWIKTRDAIRRNLSSQKSMNEIKSKILNECHRNIAAAIAAAPNSRQIGHSHELRKKILSSGKRALEKFLKKDALDIATLKFETVKYLDQQNGDIRNEVTQRLQRRLTQLINEKSEIQSAETKAREWKSLIINTVGRLQESPEASIAHPIKAVCDSIQPPVFDDSAFPSIEKIEPSWQTILFPAIGRAILAHELGHIAHDSAVTKPGADALRKNLACSNRKHTELYETYSLPYKQDLYSEEEWADDFAAATDFELNNGKPSSTNFACPMLGLSESGNYENLDLINPVSSDTHPSVIYRVLKMHLLLQKQIPESCYTAYSTNRIGIIKSRCE